MINTERVYNDILEFLSFIVISVCDFLYLVILLYIFNCTYLISLLFSKIYVEVLVFAYVKIHNRNCCCFCLQNISFACLFGLSHIFVKLYFFYYLMPYTYKNTDAKYAAITSLLFGSGILNIDKFVHIKD